MVILAHVEPGLNWAWEPSILIGLALLAAGYALAVGPLRRWGPPIAPWRAVAFYLGLLAVFVALVSPLDALADAYLFSAHMIQHMLLIFVGPPLWLLGLPGWLLERLIPAGPIRRGWESLTQPVAAWAIFSGMLWFWHYPAAYDFALAHESVHILEHLLFMGAAVIGWWPLLGERHPNRLSLGVRVLYILFLMGACTALAALITLAPHRLYAFYADQPLRWGLDPLVDQQIGGVVMWVPGHMIFTLALIVTFLRWLNTSSEEPALDMGSTYG